MKTARIAVMSSGLGHIARGIETWADSVATGLHDRGLDVTLFRGAGPATRSHERVVTCLRRGHRLAGWVTRLAPGWTWRLGLSQTYDLEQMTFAACVLPHLIRNRYHIIHLQDPWLGLMLEKTRKLHGASIILGHGTEEAPWLLRKFQHVQELSPFYLGRHGDLQGRRWFAVPNFVDTQRFHPGDKQAARKEFGLPQDAFIVLSVSALNREMKRLHWLSQEAAASGRQDLVVVVAGASDENTPALIETMKKDLGDRVHILQNVNRDRMPLLYRAADVHVMCSLKEVMSISLLEAQASGLPNLGHRWGSVEWMIENSGRVLDMEKPGELAATLRDLTHEDCERMSQLALERTRSMFSKEAVLDQFEAMYEAVLAHRSTDGRSVVVRQSAPLSTT